MSTQKINADIRITIGNMTALCLIANIQLATRHPENLGPSRKVAEEFARMLQKILTERSPEWGPLLEMGWHEANDFDATGYGDQFKKSG